MIQITSMSLNDRALTASPVSPCSIPSQELGSIYLTHDDLSICLCDWGCRELVTRLSDAAGYCRALVSPADI